ncbi:PPOX class F420-dependent oxidoreductase [Rugosimonospora acidiphila]|uniref:PPOX class F420-dependent oxidoreductase n=1 Tax=Rugosimonospora acidiphila TaxID=556531 RepID=A0ABP9RMS0_9ACTN
MSLPPLPDDAVAMLRQPNPAVIATLRANGEPVTTATWYLWEDDGRVLINMDEGRVRLGHLRRDPRVSLTVLPEGDWYTHVTLIGRVTDIAADSDLSGIDRLSRQYTGAPYPTRDRPRVNAWIEIQRWHGWGSFKDSNQAVPPAE